MAFRLYVDDGHHRAAAPRTPHSVRAWTRTLLLPPRCSPNRPPSPGSRSRGRARDQALRIRQQIGAAVGIGMQHYKPDRRSAFSFLARLSSHSNIKLREVAERILDDLTAQRERQ